MRLFRPKAGTRLRLLPPDYVEERDDRVLLVWGELPYWTVVDREFHRLLRLLDGAMPVENLIDERPEWAAQKREILGLLKTLRQAGVLQERGETPHARATEKPRIENVAINLTRRCNLRCRFCYNLPVLTKDGADELTAKEIIAFLDTARPLLAKRPVLTILGGEPLLEGEKLHEIAKYAARKKYTTLVSTNGIGVTEQFASRAALTRMQVQVSLDGPTARLHDQIRGSGSFQRTVEGIRLLVRRRAYTIVSMVCHKETLPHLEAFLEVARSLGVNEARFIPLKQLGGAVESPFRPVSPHKLFLETFRIVKERPDLRGLLGRDALSIMASTCRYAARRPSCGTGLQTVLLDADGALYPCLNTNIPEFRLGNVRDAEFDFARLWRESPVLERVRRFSSLGYMAARAHAGCPVRAWCLGGCPGENYQVQGGMELRPPHCRELRRGIISVLWMLAERPDLGGPSPNIC